MRFSVVGLMIMTPCVLNAALGQQVVERPEVPSRLVDDTDAPKLHQDPFQNEQTATPKENSLLKLRKPAPAWMLSEDSEPGKHDQITEVLSQKSAVNIQRVPLVKVMEELADKHQIPIWINESELNLIGTNSDVEVTLQLPSVSLRSALRLMLQPMDLTYVIRNSVLEITTIDSAEAEPVTSYYDLSWVVVRIEDATALVSAIEQHVDPDVWVANGGTSVISCVGQIMIVSASHSTQDKVRGMMSKLASMRLDARADPELRKAASPPVESEDPK